ncbi:hypothetical protein OH76DRAFT_331466 [Lentinus brumalis]|uniref:Uncharacterized protein n=1 Tax=Lentinus brumalis TaxID=2498619 RepID=A0A371DFV4_9APHY|nr:hypothetical protein OH76DRAFT_331466 [Polyporus brumalis]
MIVFIVVKRPCSAPMRMRPSCHPCPLPLSPRFVVPPHYVTRHCRRAHLRMHLPTLPSPSSSPMPPRARARCPVLLYPYPCRPSLLQIVSLPGFFNNPPPPHRHRFPTARCPRASSTWTGNAGHSLTGDVCAPGAPESLSRYRMAESLAPARPPAHSRTVAARSSANVRIRVGPSPGPGLPVAVELLLPLAPVRLVFVLCVAVVPSTYIVADVLRLFRPVLRSDCDLSLF